MYQQGMHGTMPFSTPAQQHNPYQVDSYSAFQQHRPGLRLPPPGGVIGTNSYGMLPSEHFSASQHDYSRMKSRKRSNLPKQSTEVMKRWFDQVCTMLVAL